MGFSEWVEANNFSESDLENIKKKATQRMFIWLVLSYCGLFFITLPLFINSFALRKIIKQRTLEPKPGIIFSLYSLAMFITFLTIIPAIIWILSRKFSLGTGIRSVIKKNQHITEEYSYNNIPNENFSKKVALLIAISLIIIFFVPGVILFRDYISKPIGKTLSLENTINTTSSSQIADIVFNESEINLTTFNEYNEQVVSNAILRFSCWTDFIYYDYPIIRSETSDNDYLGRAANSIIQYIDGEQIIAPYEIIKHVRDKFYSGEHWDSYTTEDFRLLITRYQVGDLSALFKKQMGFDSSLNEYDIFDYNLYGSFYCYAEGYVYDISNIMFNTGMGVPTSNTIKISSIYHISDDFYLVYFIRYIEYYFGVSVEETSSPGYAIIKCPSKNMNSENSEIYVWEYIVTAAKPTNSRLLSYSNTLNANASGNVSSMHCYYEIFEAFKSRNEIESIYSVSYDISDTDGDEMIFFYSYNDEWYVEVYAIINEQPYCIYRQYIQEKGESQNALYVVNYNGQACFCSLKYNYNNDNSYNMAVFRFNEQGRTKSLHNDYIHYGSNLNSHSPEKINAFFETFSSLVQNSRYVIRDTNKRTGTISSANNELDAFLSILDINIQSKYKNSNSEYMNITYPQNDKYGIVQVNSWLHLRKEPYVIKGNDVYVNDEMVQMPLNLSLNILETVETGDEQYPSWFKVSTVYNGVSVSGYCCANYISIPNLMNSGNRLKVGEKIIATVKSSQDNFSWSVNDESIASVNSKTGELIGLKPGFVTLRVSTPSGLSDYCIINVYQDEQI